jgi:hypothetical protein
MSVPPPEYSEEDRLRQPPARVRQRQGVLPPDREDAPEREMEQQGRQAREVEFPGSAGHEAHAPGRVCERCGAVITDGQDARRLTDGRWIHEACPVAPGSLAPPGRPPA